jgi:putative ABC transport system permease protein
MKNDGGELFRVIFFIGRFSFSPCLPTRQAQGRKERRVSQGSHTITLRLPPPRWKKHNHSPHPGLTCLPAGRPLTTTVPHPPKIFLRFFRWFCHPSLLRHIEGDLMELYHEELELHGKRRADLKFVIDVFLLFRPGIIRPTGNFADTNHSDMVLNYLKVGIRNILKYKVYSSINAGGLAVGIAASMLIMLYIADEVSFDRFFKNSEEIYRIGSSGSFEGSAFESAVSSPPIAAAVLQEIPEGEAAIRFGWWRAQPMRYENKTFIEKQLIAADSNFFQFFSYDLVSGNPAEVLRGTNKIVLTETTARRYFGSENPVGKILTRGEGNVATEVTGVVKDPPANSHIQFDMILSSSSWSIMQIDAWSNTFLYTYVKTKSPEQVKHKLDVIAERNLGPELERIMGVSPAQFKDRGNRFGFFLQPMLDIHLRSRLSSEITPPGNIQHIYIFGAVATFILLIACINFVNLATARATTRAKEVGVRKSIGALREKLIGQFLFESMIFSFASTIVALAITGLVLNSFNSLAGKDISLDVLMQPVPVLGLLSFALLIGLIAGIYPAFYLTRFRPVDVLKGRLTAGVRNKVFRNSLVTFQFMISIMLIIGSLVVYKQLHYMQGMSLGFDKENVIDITNGWSLSGKAQAFKSEVATYPEFRGTSFASALPPRIIDSNLFRKGGVDQDIILHVVTVDYDHLSTMGYEMSIGRFFSSEFPSDSTAIILNETAYRLLGFKEVEGNTITNFNAAQPVTFSLIGVVKDFNFEGLSSPIKPLAIILNAGKNEWMVRQSDNDVAIRINTTDMFDAITRLEAIWKKHSNLPFEFTFVDENIDATFRTEARLGGIVLTFTVLAIAIACLGLFGLAAYLAQTRSKEMSIRKILGASIPEVVLHFLKDFTLPIAVAFIIAAPVSWYLMTTWLDEFAYRTELEWWMIAISGLSAVVIAAVTVSYQSLKVATENPVNNLKNE